MKLPPENCAVSLKENYCLNDSNQFLGADSSAMPFDFFTLNAKADQSIPDAEMEGDCLPQGITSGYIEESGAYLTETANYHLPRSDSQMFDLDLAVDRSSDSSNGSRKRPRASQVQRGKRYKKARRNQKIETCNKNEDEENDAHVNRQNSGSCSSEDNSSAQDMNAGATSSLSSKEKTTLNSSGTKRASRGSATDPQSLYARKRRERINERLRILQNLVPNGTKVDISTMLEEAVQYVKFLQIQIKMLSSDEMWMYSPIAYNGMSLGFDMKIAD